MGQSASKVIVLVTIVVSDAIGGSCNESDAEENVRLPTDAAVDANGHNDTSVIDAGSFEDDSLGSSCERFESRVGLFDITVNYGYAPEYPGTAQVSGWAIIGVVLSDPQVVWEVKDASKECRLLVPRLPSCSPPCNVGSACINDNQCQFDRVAIDVGTVQIEGILTEEGMNTITLLSVPGRSGRYYTYPEPMVFPPLVEGVAVRLKANGGDYESFVIENHGISPLELISDEAILAETGQPIRFEWKRPTRPDIAKIEIEIDIRTHAPLIDSDNDPTKGRILCEVEDTGFFEIPASLVLQLFEFGYTGYPMATISRVAIGSAEITPGCVEFVVRSVIEREIEIPGVVSCQNDDDCPEDESCSTSFLCSSSG